MELNSKGVNANIKAVILSDKEMRKIGFTDHQKNKWYFCRVLKCSKDITFNVTISKDGSDDLAIDILDEQFLQPYDYQCALQINQKHPFALKVKDEIEGFMNYLNGCGVLSGHEYGAYI